MNSILFFGALGLLTEIAFTAIRNLIVHKKINLIGHTSIWMFPVYAIGLTYGFDFANQFLDNDIIRYTMYPILIWAVEILIALPLLKFGVRLWNYDYLPDKLHWRGVISFAHYPLWAAFAILVEYLKAII